MDRKRATLTGPAAILLWSTMVGLIRSVSEGLGPVGGAAMIYTVSGLLCLVTVGFPIFGVFPCAISLRAASCLSAMRCARPVAGVCRDALTGD